jgi:DNA-binding HxlR family transcriptional regulator
VTSTSTRSRLPAPPATLTALGHSLAEAVVTIRDWSYEHMDEIEGARSRFDARPASAGPPTPVAAAAA